MISMRPTGIRDLSQPPRRRTHTCAASTTYVRPFSRTETAVGPLTWVLPSAGRSLRANFRRDSPCRTRVENVRSCTLPRCTLACPAFLFAFPSVIMCTRICTGLLRDYDLTDSTVKLLSTDPHLDENWTAVLFGIFEFSISSTSAVES